HIALVQALGERVRVDRLRGRRERHPVPGRVVRAEAKLAEPGGERQLLRGALPVGRNGGERRGLEARAGDQGRVGGADAGQLAQGLERADAELWMLLRQRTPIVEQDRAQPYERFVHLRQRRGRGLLVAADRADQVTLQGRC